MPSAEQASLPRAQSEAQADPLRSGIARAWERRSARRAAGVLVAFVLLALFAPLLSNDRPYYLFGVDVEGYARALDELRHPAEELSALLRRAASGSGASEGGAALRDRLRSEVRALILRADRLTRLLEPAARAPIEALISRARGIEELAAGGTLAEAEREARVIDAEVEVLGRTHRVRSAEREDGVELVPRWDFPLFHALTRTQAGGIGFGLILAAFCLRRAFARRGQLPRGALGRWAFAASLATLALATASGSLAGFSGGSPGESYEHATDFKSRIASGEIVADRALFPPIPFTYASTRSSEAWRAPSWTSASRQIRAEEEPAAFYAESAWDSMWRHPLGTDFIGRDVLARIVWGTRRSLAIACGSTLLLFLLGVAIGSVAGYAGGRADLFLSRLIEVVQSFPALLLVLALAAIVPPRGLAPALTVALVIALVRWTGIARLVRAECLRLREREWVLAARSLGLSNARIVWVHVLPHALGPALVAGAFAFGACVLTEAALAFLGLGVAPPEPSWGSLIGDTGSLVHWWSMLFPGLCVCLCVAASNALGEALSEALDPRSGGERP